MSVTASSVCKGSGPPSARANNIQSLEGARTALEAGATGTVALDPPPQRIETGPSHRAHVLLAHLQGQGGTSAMLHVRVLGRLRNERKGSDIGSWLFLSNRRIVGE